MEEASVLSIYTVQNRRFPVSIKHGLWGADCGLQTTDWYKTWTEVDLALQTGYKTWTGVLNTDCGLNAAYQLQCVFYTDRS